MYPYLKIFSLEIPTYYIMMLLGVGFAFLVIYLINKKNKKNNLTFEDLGFLIMYVMIGALVGAKILFIITMIPKMITNPEIIYAVIFQGGMVFYGGVIGAIIMAFYYIRQYGLDPVKYTNVITIGLPLGHAFGRIGCFLAGCCHGKVTDSIFGVSFPAGPLFLEATPKVHPTQAYEAIFELLVFTVFIILFFKLKKHRDYLFPGLYLVTYGIFRFFIEFLRGDTIRGIFILSTSQWISIVLFLIGIFIN